MIYMVDIDGTICKEVLLPSGKKDYINHVPIQSRIDKVNELFAAGNEIHFWTARGATSGIDYTDLTRDQLKRWNVSYTSLRVGDKPHYDIWVDDKAINDKAFFDVR